MSNGTTSSTTPESKTQVVVRLLRQGGYVLIAGGGISELPERIRSHPQILLWDDNKQGALQKTVPSNTRCIVFNQWISHAMVGRLRNAADKLHIPIFPMMRTREIKELLAEIMHEPVVPTTTVEEVPLEPEPVVTPTTVPETAPPTMSEEPMALRKIKRGEHRAILAKELSPDIKSISPADEAKRLLPIYRGRYGIKIDLGPVEQAIYHYKVTNGKGYGKDAKPPRPIATVEQSEVAETKATTPPTSISSMADFDEAERMLRDARAALDLILGLVPKLKKELVAARKRQEKLRALLMD